MNTNFIYTLCTFSLCISFANLNAEATQFIKREKGQRYVCHSQIRSHLWTWSSYQTLAGGAGLSDVIGWALSPLVSNFFATYVCKKMQSYSCELEECLNFENCISPLGEFCAEIPTSACRLPACAIEWHPPCLPSCHPHHLTPTCGIIPYCGERTIPNNYTWCPNPLIPLWGPGNCCCNAPWNHQAPAQACCGRLSNPAYLSSCGKEMSQCYGLTVQQPGEFYPVEINPTCETALQKGSLQYYGVPAGQPIEWNPGCQGAHANEALQYYGTPTEENGLLNPGALQYSFGAPTEQTATFNPAYQEGLENVPLQYYGTPTEQTATFNPAYQEGLENVPLQHYGTPTEQTATFNPAYQEGVENGALQYYNAPEQIGETGATVSPQTVNGSMVNQSRNASIESGQTGSLSEPPIGNLNSSTFQNSATIQRQMQQPQFNQSVQEQGF